MAEEKKPAQELIPIYVMGVRYEVPPTLTIMKAMEFVGYTFIRGCGCRAGVCGACGTIYRLPNDYKLYTGLACQTLVEPNMYLTQIPFYPANKATYDIEKLSPEDSSVFVKFYPELARCMGCNSCTQICPQDLEVMEYIAMALRGDIKKCASLAFECIQCGLCASRCPAEIVHYHIGMMAKRLEGRYIRPRAPELTTRVAEVKDGQYVDEIAELKALGKEQLIAKYKEIQADKEPA